MEIDEYDEFGNVSKATQLFEVFNEPLSPSEMDQESSSGPENKRLDGKWFGFDQEHTR